MPPEDVHKRFYNKLGNYLSVVIQKTPGYYVNMDSEKTPYPVKIKARQAKADMKKYYKETGRTDKDGNPPVLFGNAEDNIAFQYRLPEQVHLSGYTPTESAPHPGPDAKRERSFTHYESLNVFLDNIENATFELRVATLERDREDWAASIYPETENILKSELYHFCNANHSKQRITLLKRLET